MSEHSGKPAFGGEHEAARGPVPESAEETTLEYPSGLVPDPAAAVPRPDPNPGYSFLPEPGPGSGPGFFPEPDPRADPESDPDAGPGLDPGLDLDGKPPAKRSRIALITVGAATFAVTAGVLLGVSLYQTPSRSDSVQDDLRAGVPDQVSTSAEATGSASPSASGTSASPSSSASASASESTSTSPTASPSVSPTATPTASPTSAPDPTPPSGGGAEAPRVLRLGDTGPQVRELQLRLKEIGRYDGEATGVYDESVQSAVRTYQFTRLILSDESGVYGAATRESLESETRNP
ncbi:peptidoglycan-binding protein [Streptomyces roseirectus]|uniref:Peptidoglycan-binding protein n=1 Tax=Streptomyces roseirectus TaxID=2768066 RepID=A0A7H0IP78_9ACTN|nr:peptidoglycan-binding domain-containing protein [Streptomyces roseirectus]QNP74594.1 peptidoglycan-binding protein [Streptomyces roseirectus]